MVVVTQFSYRRGRLHERGHTGEDIVGGLANDVFGRLSTAQNVVHLGDDVGSVSRRLDAQEVVFLEVLRRVVAKPLFDLVREAVQVGVAIDVRFHKCRIVEPGQYLNDVEYIGDQRAVEARLGFVNGQRSR